MNQLVCGRNQAVVTSPIAEMRTSCSRLVRTLLADPVRVLVDMRDSFPRQPRDCAATSRRWLEALCCRRHDVAVSRAGGVSMSARADALAERFRRANRQVIAL